MKKKTITITIIATAIATAITTSAPKLYREFRAYAAAEICREGHGAPTKVRVRACTEYARYAAEDLLAEYFR